MGESHAKFPGQWAAVLRVIARRPRTPSEMLRDHKRQLSSPSQASLAMTLQRMRAKKLIERVRRPDDYKSVAYCMTQLGSHALAAWEVLRGITSSGRKPQ